jgi:hypothetical protein
MEPKEQLTEFDTEFNKQEFEEELDVIKNEINKIEEKALKMKCISFLLLNQLFY